jgi:AraC-like DNA-binding protein
MHYKTYQPPSYLSQVVRYFWSFDSVQNTKGELLITSFADRYPRLIFQDWMNYNPIRNTEGVVLPQCYLSGIDTQKSDYLMGNSFSHFGVSFYPHALKSIFKVDAHELINQLPDIHLFDNLNINLQLQNAPTHTARIAIISAFLYRKMENYDKYDPLINHLILNECISESSLFSHIQKEHNISERHLERKFKAFVGVSPKKLQRIIRFEKSLSLLKNAQYSDLTQIGYDLGYTDQSHFIKDFKSFAGLSPYTFLSKNTLGAESSSFIFNPPDVL